MNQFSSLLHQSTRTYISQGEFAIEQGQDKVIATLLGSCVSACLWDGVIGVGGMNHVLFTDDTQNAEEVFGHGVNGMELLINGLIRKGARRLEFWPASGRARQKLVLKDVLITAPKKIEVNDVELF